MSFRRRRAPRIEDLFDWAIPPSRSGVPAAERPVDDTALPRAELVRLDRQLARLGRTAGRWRLELGELMERFQRGAGPHEFGYSSAGGYGLQNVGQTARWCDDSRAMARRLETLPLTRAALTSGRIAWSMAELLSRHATPETEAVLLSTARDKTVRAMKDALDAAKRRQDEELGVAKTPPLAVVTDPELAPTLPSDITQLPIETERSTLQVTVPTDAAWAYEYTRILLDRGLATPRTDDAIEAMLAEGAITLSLLCPDRAVPVAPPPDPCAPWRQEQLRADAALEAALEHRVDLGLDDDDLGPLPHMADLPADIHALHERIVARALAFSGRHLELGQTARRFWRADGWRKLGYLSDTQYCRERIGCSLRSVQQRMKLARGVADMPAVETALRDHTIGFESALLILTRTTPEHAAAWIARAEERTVQSLRDELDVAGAMARLHASNAWLAPPSEQVVAEYAAHRQAVLSGRAFQESGSEAFQRVTFKTQISGDRLDSAERADPVKPGVGVRTLRFRLEPDLARWYRALSDHWRYARCGRDVGDTFLDFLCGATVGAWMETVRDVQKVAYANIYARDGYRCSNPVCNRRDVTPHHVVFRSHGGDDDDDNLSALCAQCHLEGVHRGRLRLEGTAGRLRWKLGRVPHMTVDGTRAIQVAA